MSAALQELLENPMLVETRRFGRKFFGISRFQRFPVAIVVLLAICYAFLLLITIAYRDGLTSDYIFQCQTLLYCFIVPTMTFGAVAGEREKRTWDLLLVAPISKTQIILGKYISAVVVLVVTFLCFLPMILITAFSNHETATAVLTNTVISLGFGCGFTAIGIFISSLMSRGFVAQLTIYAVLFLWMIMVPMLISFVLQYNNASMQLMWIHPFTAIAAIGNHFRESEFEGNFGYSLVAQLVLYGLMALFFVYGAVAHITRGGRRSNA